MDITQILFRKYPTSEWYMNGDDYSGLTWLSDTPKPSEAQLEALWPQVEHEVAYEQVEQARQVAYRETSDPLFFEYQRGDKTEADWLAAVQEVKTANPYPTTDETS